jgi:uncharacterized protein YcfJ
MPGHQQEQRMNKKLQAVLGVCAIAAATHAAAAITFYEGEGFRGRAVTTDERVWNFERFGFNDRASSVVVDRGAWEVCEHARFEGRCVILRRGSYPSLRGVGLDNQISSARPYEPREHHGRRHDDDADAPRAYAPPPPAPMYQPQPAFYDVPVSAVHAVVGPPSQRCWVEREQVAQPRGGEPNVGGAVLGGLVGGLLGHQVGGGSGKDLATVGGVVAGAAIGANVNRDGTDYQTRDVQRCRTVTDAQPAYYDVAYWYRGVEHHAQMTAAPGATIRVNAQGVPVVAR